jgi:peptidyl-tRNA hydrolase
MNGCMTTVEPVGPVETLETVLHWRKRWRSGTWVDRAGLDETEPWAMSLVVRAEKSAPPDHQHAMYAAALAVVRLLVDPASAPGGPWHDGIARWMDGRIRKVVRRARGIRWTEVGALPGVTVTVWTAAVRALLPHAVTDIPPEVARLQVQGLDLATDPDLALDRVTTSPDGQVGAAPGEPAGPVLSIALAPGVRMSTGKACAQVGHAAQLALLDLDETLVRDWLAAGLPLRILEVSPEQWARIWRGELAAAVVQDAGYTEVAPGTHTCAATFADLGRAG